MARRSPRAVGGAGAASSGATPTGKRGRGTFDNPVEFASEGSHDGDDEPRDMLNGDGDADGDADGDDDGEWGLARGWLRLYVAHRSLPVVGDVPEAVRINRVDQQGQLNVANTFAGDDNGK